MATTGVKATMNNRTGRICIRLFRTDWEWNEATEEYNKIQPDSIEMCYDKEELKNFTQLFWNVTDDIHFRTFPKHPGIKTKLYKLLRERAMKYYPETFIRTSNGKAQLAR